MIPFYRKILFVIIVIVFASGWSWGASSITPRKTLLLPGEKFVVDYITPSEQEDPHFNADDLVYYSFEQKQRIAGGAELDNRRGSVKMQAPFAIGKYELQLVDWSQIYARAPITVGVRNLPEALNLDGRSKFKWGEMIPVDVGIENVDNSYIHANLVRLARHVPGGGVLEEAVLERVSFRDDTTAHKFAGIWEPGEYEMRLYLFQYLVASKSINIRKASWDEVFTISANANISFKFLITPRPNYNLTDYLFKVKDKIFDINNPRVFKYKTIANSRVLSTLQFSRPYDARNPVLLFYPMGEGLKPLYEIPINHKLAPIPAANVTKLGKFVEGRGIPFSVELPQNEVSDFISLGFAGRGGDSYIVRRGDTQHLFRRLYPGTYQTKIFHPIFNKVSIGEGPKIVREDFNEQFELMSGDTYDPGESIHLRVRRLKSSYSVIFRPTTGTDREVIDGGTIGLQPKTYGSVGGPDQDITLAAPMAPGDYVLELAYGTPSAPSRPGTAPGIIKSWPILVRDIVITSTKFELPQSAIFMKNDPVRLKYQIGTRDETGNYKINLYRKGMISGDRHPPIQTTVLPAAVSGELLFTGAEDPGIYTIEIVDLTQGADVYGDLRHKSFTVMIIEAESRVHLRTASESFALGQIVPMAIRIPGSRDVRKFRILLSKDGGSLGRIWYGRGRVGDAHNSIFDFKAFGKGQYAAVLIESLEDNTVRYWSHTTFEVGDPEVLSNMISIDADSLIGAMEPVKINLQLPENVYKEAYQLTLNRIAADGDTFLSEQILSMTPDRVGQSRVTIPPLYHPGQYQARLEMILDWADKQLLGEVDFTVNPIPSDFEYFKLYTARVTVGDTFELKVNPKLKQITEFMRPRPLTIDSLPVSGSVGSSSELGLSIEGDHKTIYQLQASYPRTYEFAYHIEGNPRYEKTVTVVPEPLVLELVGGPCFDVTTPINGKLSIPPDRRAILEDTAPIGGYPNYAIELHPIQTAYPASVESRYVNFNSRTVEDSFEFNADRPPGAWELRIVRQVKSPYLVLSRAIAVAATPRNNAVDLSQRTLTKDSFPLRVNVTDPSEDIKYHEISIYKPGVRLPDGVITEGRIVTSKKVWRLRKDDFVISRRLAEPGRYELRYGANQNWKAKWPITIQTIPFEVVDETGRIIEARGEPIPRLELGAPGGTCAELLAAGVNFDADAPRPVPAVDLPLGQPGALRSLVILTQNVSGDQQQAEVLLQNGTFYIDAEKTDTLADSQVVTLGWGEGQTRDVYLYAANSNLPNHLKSDALKLAARDDDVAAEKIFVAAGSTLRVTGGGLTAEAMVLSDLPDDQFTVKVPITSDPLVPAIKQPSHGTPAYIARGVHAPDGAFMHSETDLIVKSAGMPFEWKRTYRSSIEMESGGLIGHGWDFSYNKRIVPLGRRNDDHGLFLEQMGAEKPALYYYDGTGRSDLYEENESGWRRVKNFGKLFAAYVTQYNSPPGVRYEIMRYVLRDNQDHPFASHPQVDTESEHPVFYTIRDYVGNFAIFNERGQLIYLRDRHGNKMGFLYAGPWNPLTENKSLSSIRDTAGRDYTLRYTTFGEAEVLTHHNGERIKTSMPIPHLEEIEDFSGRKIKYQYGTDDDGRIARLDRSVTDYGNGSIHKKYAFEKYQKRFLLTKIVAPRTSEDIDTPYLENSYREGKVEKQIFGNDATLFEYQNDQVTLTDPLQNKHNLKIAQNDSGPVIASETITPADRTEGGPWKTDLEYNVMGLITRRMLPRGNAIEYQYKEENEPVSEGDERNWLERQYAYANNLSRGNLIAVIRHSHDSSETPVKITERWQYEPLYNQLAKYTAPDEKATTYTYDHAKGRGYRGNPVSQELPQIDRPREGSLTGINEQYEYNDQGLLTRKTDTGGRLVTFHYQDKTGYLTKIAYPLNRTHTFEVDPRGNVTREILPGGRKVTYRLNQRDLTVEKIDDDGGFANRTRYEYDDHGNLIKQVSDKKDNFTAQRGAPRPDNQVISQVTYEATYDILDRIVASETKETAGQAVRLKWSYDSSGNVASLERPSPAGTGTVKTHTTYNARNLPKVVTEAHGTSFARATRFKYDDNGNVIEKWAGETRLAAHQYDGFDRLRTRTDAEGGVMTRKYNRKGEIIEEKFAGKTGDAAGTTGILSKTAYEYDAAGHMTRQRVFTLNGSNQSVETIWIYNEGFQIEKILTTSGGRTEYQYDAAGRTTTIADGADNILKYEYDGADNIVSIQSVDQVYRYEPESRQANEGTETHQVTIAFDKLNRPVARTLPNGRSEYFYYDSLGNVRGEVNEQGVLSQRRFDAFKQVLQATTRGITTTYAYSGQGHLLASSSSLSRESYQYDVLGRLKEINRNGRITGYNYQEAARETTETQPNGTQITHKRNAMGWNIQSRMSYREDDRRPRTSLINRRFDGLGRMVFADDRGSKVSLAYDGLDRIIKDRQTFGTNTQEVRIEYKDRAAQRIVHYPPAASSYGSFSVTYQYDNLSRVRSVSSSSASAAYRYSGKDRLAYIKTGDGRFATFMTYDERRRLTERHVTDGMLGDKFWRAQINYDGQNRPDEYTETQYDWQNKAVSHRSVTNYFDQQNRIERVDSRMLFQEGTTQKYLQFNRKSLKEFDDHQRLARTVDLSYTSGGSSREKPAVQLWADIVGGIDPHFRLVTQNFQYNNDNLRNRVTTRVIRAEKMEELELAPNQIRPDRMRQLADEMRDISDVQDIRYDENGNLIEDDRFLYFYSYDNRLIEIEDKWTRDFGHAAYDKVLFAYDALGRRIFRGHSASPSAVLNEYNRRSLRYLYDGNRCIAETALSSPNDIPSLFTRYVYGIHDGDVLSVERRKDDKVDADMAQYYTHNGIWGNISLLSSFHGNTFIGTEQKRPYRGDSLLGLRKERYIDKSKTRFNLLSGSSEVETFASLYLNRLTHRYQYDFTSPPGLDYRLYVLENWDEIRKKVHDRYGMSKELEMVMIVPLAMTLTGGLAGPVALGEGLVYAGIDFAYSQITGQEYRPEDFVMAMGMGVLGSAPVWLKGTTLGARLGAIQIAKNVAVNVGIGTAFNMAVMEDPFADAFFKSFLTAAHPKPPRQYSFVRGTRVLTDQGPKAIETIQVDDRVLARDEATGSVGYKPVTQAFKSTTHKLVHLTYRDPDNGELHTFQGTPGHEIWAQSKQAWIKLGELQAGDELLSSNGQVVAVEDLLIETLPDGENEDVYNFEVADWHNYFITDGSGKTTIWVHNQPWNMARLLRAAAEVGEAQERRLNELLQLQALMANLHARSRQLQQIVRPFQTVISVGAEVDENVITRILVSTTNQRYMDAVLPFLRPYEEFAEGVALRGLPSIHAEINILNNILPGRRLLAVGAGNVTGHCFGCRRTLLQHGALMASPRRFTRADLYNLARVTNGASVHNFTREELNMFAEFFRHLRRAGAPKYMQRQGFLHALHGGGSSSIFTGLP